MSTARLARLAGRCLLAAWVASLPCSAAPAAASAPPAAARADAATLTAVMLLRFSQFTEWPEEQRADAGRPLVLCTLGPGPVARRLEEVGQRQGALGRQTVQVRQVQAADEARQCHVLYLEQPQDAPAAAVLRHLREAPVLTVATLSPGAAATTHIELQPRGERLAFAVDTEAARRARLRLSADLLELAVPTGMSGGGGR